jgi:hypothetical protein
MRCLTRPLSGFDFRYPAHRKRWAAIGDHAESQKQSNPMTLHSPFIISSRLLPAVSIGQGSEQITVSLSPSGFIMDGPFGEHRVTGLRLSPLCNSIESAFETLLSFMTAAAESFRYRGMDGENADLFPAEVTEAISQVSSELECVWFEIHSAIESDESLVTE